MRADRERKDLIELWNDKSVKLFLPKCPQSSLIITVMAMLGYFDGEYNYGISFAALFLVSVGALSVLNQLARSFEKDFKMIIKDLQSVDNPSALATRLRPAVHHLVAYACLMIIFSLALLFVLVLLNFSSQLATRLNAVGKSTRDQLRPSRTVIPRAPSFGSTKYGKTGSTRAEVKARHFFPMFRSGRGSFKTGGRSDRSEITRDQSAHMRHLS